MKKMLVATLVLLTGMNTLWAQVKSPEAFLGYKIGSRYTPHWKIVNYFNYVAAAIPSMVKLQTYGETNEGRPLMVAFVSSAENMGNLEQVRINNLRLANLARDRAAAVEENAPAIVWLSYNVHGNETSSSEAALLTLYALVDPANAKTKEWLKNTVVAIDPCINPDGRDRYVNWFNSVVGKKPNPQAITREHREPWPGGRSNHYNFDLNRDWAWQTQVESQQRISIYSEWMPHIHVDYHEQGMNEPYYFAPAAQPFHEVITPWQREFQTTIGRNHAKYFDANGWLYFTKEVFDLYYPSYGDTWPTYNGAIGMTYEQGGGGAGGAAVINDEGDTLTLYDRAIHHFTTSISTIEISSLNASRLVKEFRKFFNEAVSTGIGEYKSYVIRNNAKDRERINALLGLLTKNGIQFGYASSGTGRGYSYANGKEESFNLQNDIVITAVQPRSAMVKVLFEPRPKLVDSLTYDITAWSLPYAYGVQAWASRERINAQGMSQPAFVPNTPADSYGYVIRWQGLQSVRTVGQLLQKGIRLRFAE
ncbi:MAG TPA: M14 metallopeptidase family protein, partial [Chitinophagaceae bacterium]|nr:M14 metallopeptidase family protein [Chitinophagaceae bacterium]